MINHTAEDILRRWGLTQNQSKVYITLLKTGTAKIQRIAQIADIAQGDVYRTIEFLERLGLVERVVSAPRLYYPIPLADAIAILSGRRNKKQLELEENTDKLLSEKMGDSEFESYSDLSHFILFYKPRAIQKIRNAIDNLKKEVDIIASVENPRSILYRNIEELIDAAKKGIKVRILIWKIEQELAPSILVDLKNIPSVEIRYIEKSPSALLSIYDKREAIIFTEPLNQKCPVLWISNTAMLKIFRDYFERIWASTPE